MDSENRNVCQVLNNDNAIIIKEINHSLSTTSSKEKGLYLLNCVINKLSVEEYVENCMNWMQWCCKKDSSINVIKPSLQILGILIQESSKHAELNKPVSHFLSTRFFGKNFQLWIQFDEGWKCVEKIFQYYRGSCVSHSENIKQFLQLEIEKKSLISPVISHIYSLLPGIGENGGEFNYKTKWKNQFETILNQCQSILQDLFTDMVELEMYDHLSYVKYCSFEVIDENHLYSLFYNSCSVLQSMLLCKFPVSKTIIPEKVFDVICRCLNVSSKNFGNSCTTRALNVLALLPQFQISAYSLLKALIISCKTHLLPYSQLITKLIRQTLQLSSVSSPNSKQNQDIDLRISAYDTLRNWLMAARGGAYTESISKVIIPAVLDDILTKEAFILLKDTKTSNEVCNQKSLIPKICFASNEKLCFSALKSLELILREFGCVLKSEQHKVLQLSIIKQISDVQSCYLTKEFIGPYASSKCRYQLYCLLLALVNYSCSSWPSPLHWAFQLLTKGVNDYDVKISSYCSTAIVNFVNIIHPEYHVALSSDSFNVLCTA